MSKIKHPIGHIALRLGALWMAQAQPSVSPKVAARIKAREAARKAKEAK